MGSLTLEEYMLNESFTEDQIDEALKTLFETADAIVDTLDEISDVAVGKTVGYNLMNKKKGKLDQAKRILNRRPASKATKIGISIGLNKRNKQG